MISAFGDVLTEIHRAHGTYATRNLNFVMSANDDMINRNNPVWFEQYIQVGKSAIENIFSAMIACSKPALHSVLDMPCGFGRVTRHLSAAFPDADLYVCDLYQDRIDFCAHEFGATPIKSREYFDQILLPTKFDLIWCGSLLTHLDEAEFKAALALFSRSLNPEGIAVVTTHGRHSPYIQHNKWKYLPDEQFARAEEDFRTSGFGYVDYNAPEIYTEQPSYGISISSPAYIASLLEKDESIQMRGFIERGWDGHQDVVILHKLPINS